MILEKNFLLRVWGKKDYLDIFPGKSEVLLTEKSLNLERIKQTIPDSLIDLEKYKSFILNYSFDSLNAISFTKGCYIGQENTSRQNYRGKKKYELKTIKLIEGKFPDLHEPLFVMSQKIGIMKSHVNRLWFSFIKVRFL